MFRFRAMGSGSTGEPIVQFDFVFDLAGPGPFVLTGDQPQVYRYTGTEPGAVSVVLPSFAAGAGWSSTGYLFVIENSGTGGGTIDVTNVDGFPVDNGTGIAVGEARWFLWEGGEPRYLMIATNSIGGGGSFVNPMLNDTYLQGEDTLSAVHNLLGIDVGDVVRVGSAAVLGLVVNSGIGNGRLAYSGGLVYTWNAAAFYPNLATSSAGTTANRWAGVWNSRANSCGGRIVTNADVTVTFDDGYIVANCTDGNVRTITLPLITAATVGVQIILSNPSSGGLAANRTIAASGGQAIAGSTTLGNSGGITGAVSVTMIALEATAGVYYWARTT